MKKIIVFSAIMAVSLSLISCIPINVSSLYERSMSENAEQPLRNGTYELTGWYENTFIYKDIAITVPDDWDKIVADDLNNLYDERDYDSDVSILMLSMDPEATRTIAVMTELYVGSQLNEEEYLKEIQKTIESYGTIVIEPELQNVMLGEHNYKYLTLHRNIDGVAMIQFCAVRKIDNEILTISYAGEQETTIDELSELFSIEGQIL